MGCRESSVDSSAPTILPPKQTYNAFFIDGQICAIFVMRKGRKYKKILRLAHFLKTMKPGFPSLWLRLEYFLFRSVLLF